MPYLTQLAAVARRTGYPVTEVTGWKTRGHGPQPEVQGIVCHHTAGATAGGDYPTLGVVRDGRVGLSGPLSHFGLGRSGRIYVIAAGLCWHNAPSTSSYHTNSASIGIEAENNGRQAWPAVQLAAYKRLCAELCREFGLPASRVKGHKEVNTQKPDPHHVNMSDFRADVARLIKGEDDVSAEEVWNYPIDTGDGKAPWRAKSVLGNIEKDQDKTNAELATVKAMLTRLEAQGQARDAAIAELTRAVAALAVNRADLDADALVERIREQIEAVSVRLDVQTEES